MHISEVRLRRLAGRIHSLGERPLFELFRELDRGEPLRAALERYARLEPLAAFMAVNGGDRLIRPHLIAGSKR